MKALQEIPAHLWLLLMNVLLLLAWEVRPDAVVQSLLLQASGAYFTSLVPTLRDKFFPPTQPEIKTP